MTDEITNALDDLETAADYVEKDGLEYDAEMIRECIKTIRDELPQSNNTDKEDYE